ncbi:MAG: nucleotidyltransferase family protein [Thermoanaerobacteraceae bacterium]|nr:nucleotidyltransferase family protein [Thermoanaerobacteraceae bacterium]
MDIAGIILAAGFSTRMGQDKLMLPFGSSRIIERVIDASVCSNLAEVIMVYRREYVAEIGKARGIKTVFNDRSKDGMASSIVKGVSEMGIFDGYMVILGDMPFITQDIIDGLISCFKDRGDIVVPVYGGKKGHPVLIGGEYYNELLSLGDDMGARPIIASHPERVIKVEFDSSVLIDIDTPEDYIRIGDELNGHI